MTEDCGLGTKDWIGSLPTLCPVKYLMESTSIGHWILEYQANQSNRSIQISPTSDAGISVSALMNHQ